MGKQHCKTALLKMEYSDVEAIEGEEYLCLMGSANWSVATGANNEANVKIESPPDSFVRDWLKNFYHWWEKGVEASEVENEMVQRNKAYRTRQIIEGEEEYDVPFRGSGSRSQGRYPRRGSK